MYRYLIEGMFAGKYRVTFQNRCGKLYMTVKYHERHPYRRDYGQIHKDMRRIFPAISSTSGSAYERTFRLNPPDPEYYLNFFGHRIPEYEPDGKGVLISKQVVDNYAC